LEDIDNAATKTVELPPSSSPQQLVAKVPCNPALVIVGANGSGKTRVGVWLETKGPQRSRVHRIPAQRTLRFPASISPIGLQTARDAFQWGERPRSWDEPTWLNNRDTHKISTRYGYAVLGNVASASISDFDKLLVLMFSENYTQLLQFEKATRKSRRRVPPPDTILHRASRLWQAVLPHRVLEFESGEVRARPTEGPGDSYLATGLSDGERAVFYLIGQCLCAVADAVIVIDEPELHLHPSIQQKLWDAIEAERADCQFVYITHDLSFAESREQAATVWLKSSDGTSFDWHVVGDTTGIPEAVYLEILGSRQSALFIEGTHESVDYDVARAVYPTFIVKPMGSCSNVIAATKAFRRWRTFHRMECFGVVDRDYLSQKQIDAYRRSGVFVPKVAEMENLFLSHDVLALMNDQLGTGSGVVTAVQDMVFNEFQRLKSEHVLALTKRDIALTLGSYAGGDSTAEVVTELADLMLSMDVNNIFSRHLAATDDIIGRRDYESVLRDFNHKGLVDRASGLFGLTKPSYMERVRALLRAGHPALVRLLKAWLPELRG